MSTSSKSFASRLHWGQQPRCSGAETRVESEDGPGLGSGLPACLPFSLPACFLPPRFHSHSRQLGPGRAPFLPLPSDRFLTALSGVLSVCSVVGRLCAVTHAPLATPGSSVPLLCSARATACVQTWAGHHHWVSQGRVQRGGQEKGMGIILGIMCLCT